MKTISLAQLAASCGGDLIQGDAKLNIESGVSTDSRNLPAGAAFFALVGEKFDAHDFLDQVAEQAGVVIVSKLPPSTLLCPVILVDDTLIALQRLASWYRQELHIPVIGITGSNGKTSTKDFTHAVLSQKFRTFATHGNLNNHIGVPLSILSIEESHEVAVIEMGMNHSGEIAPLCRIAAPDHGIITSIGTAHIEFLGSREAIAEEKSALARALPSKGTLALPASCDFTNYISRRTSARVTIVGNCRGQVRAEFLETTPQGSSFELVIHETQRIPMHLPVAGKHMVSNALLAAAIGHALGLTASEIAQGLQSASLTSGRLRQFNHHDITIWDDTYNANPESIIAAIHAIKDTPLAPGSQRAVVLGHMAELGQHLDASNRRVAETLHDCQIDLVITVGDLAKGIAEHFDQISPSSAAHFSNHADAAQFIQSQLRPRDAVLFKGSRTAAIERVMNLAFPTT